MSDVLDAYNSIKEDGGELTMTLIGDQTINPLTGVQSGDSDVSISTYGVQTSFELSDVDGSLIRIDDCKFLVPAYGLEGLSIKSNKVNLRIDWNSETWKIQNIKSISPYGVDILYICHSRK